MKLIKDINFQFGFIFSIIFLILGIYFFDNINVKIILFICFFILLIISFLKPKVLEKPTKLWIRLGFFLGKIISPIFLFLIYFFLVTPIGILLKIIKKDVLLLKMDKNKNSYWINKSNNTSNMRDQF